MSVTAVVVLAEAVIDAPTEKPRGVLIERVEVKDVALPDSMKRCMSRQAEAECERRAPVIAADGEYRAKGTEVPSGPTDLAQAAALAATGSNARGAVPAGDLAGSRPFAAAGSAASG